MTAPKSRYAARRRLLVARGQWQPYTDAAPVRAHAQALLAARISRAEISRRSGASYATLTRLLHGEPFAGKPPASRIRPHLAAAILAVTADPDRITGPARVPALATSRRLRALTACGWSPRLLAQRLGLDLGAMRKTRDGTRRYVTGPTARGVRGLYDELWDQPPPQGTTPARIAAAKARAYAMRHTWAPPMAWDDDTIGDPAATPAATRPGRVTHRAADLAEDAAELLGQGHTREQAAQRLGVSRDALEMAIRRTRRAA